MNKGLGIALLLGPLALSGGCDDKKKVVSGKPDARVVEVGQVRDAVLNMPGGAPSLQNPVQPPPEPTMDDKSTSSKLPQTPQPSKGIPVDMLVKSIWGPRAELIDQGGKKYVVTSRRKLLMPLLGGRFGKAKFLPNFAHPHMRTNIPSMADQAKCALDLKKQMLGEDEDVPISGTEEFMAAALRMCADKRKEGK